MASELEDNLMKSLDTRMREYEANSRGVKSVEPNTPFIIRLDGNGFSKFTKNLEKPFDVSFSNAMISTCIDLVDKFGASTGYTHSDEITLIFPSCNEESVHMHGGKTMKLVSLTAAYCSVRFNYHFKTDKSVIFDSRLIVYPEPYEILNHMLWRSMHDCYRNCVSSYTDKYVGKKKTHGVNVVERIKMLGEVGIDFNNVDEHWKHGTYVKRKKIKKTVEFVSKLTGVKEIIECDRNEYIPFTMQIHNSPENLKLLFDKYTDN
jgi:tRNA(His) guanylyltransferase